MKKYQSGGYVIQKDNTSVQTQPVIRYEISPKYRHRLIEQIIKRNQGRIYDADKARFYENKQNMYNSSLLGPSSPTYYDYTTQEGQNAIDAAFNQTASNSKDLIYNMAGTVAGAYMGILPRGRWISGRIEKLSPHRIGGGAEVEVFDNGLQVLKVGTVTPKEMTKRNSIPNTIKSKLVGRVKTPYAKLPAYTQKKVKVLTEETFPKYVEKLDQAMQKSGFRRVNDSNVQYRAYTNGKVVVDDVAPGNVGLDWLRRPRIIDSSVQTVPDWIGMGFTLKNGGKILY